MSTTKAIYLYERIHPDGTTERVLLVLEVREPRRVIDARRAA